MQRRVLNLFVAGALAATATTPSASQVFPARAENVAPCGAVAERFAVANATPRSALHESVDCESVIVTPVPRSWRANRGDSASLLATVTPSRVLRDRRVLSAVLESLSDTTRPFLVRATALSTIDTGINPTHIGVIAREPTSGNRLDDALTRCWRHRV